MDNKKALEISLIARKAAYDFLQVLDDDEDVFVNFYDHHENDLAQRFQAAINEATADLRTQLAEQDALIQKHLSTITELEASVKERDAQLAAEREEVAELLKELKWVRDFNSLKTGLMSGTQYAKWMAEEAIKKHYERHATRQPTQDKGE